MSIPITLNYNDSADYDFPDTIDITGGKAQLKLLEGNVDFTEDFADDTGFTYDSNKSEFIGGLNRQKDQRPANATFFTNFKNLVTKTNPQDTNWSNGIRTGTLNGGATVSGDELDCSGFSGKYCIYDAENNANHAQILCIRVRFKTGYTGFPSSTNHIVNINKGDGGIDNLIQVYHQNTGTLSYGIYDDNGSPIFNTSIGGWSPTIGVPNEIEFNIDITNGATNFFIDGIKQGTTLTQIGTRNSSNIHELALGTNHSHLSDGDNYYLDVLIFNSIQHTTDYTPDWSNISDYIYAETYDELPEMEHTGDGSILAFNLLSLTYSGSPRILLEIGRSGDKLYWDGDSWEASDESYDQSTDLTTFNANVDSLAVEGEKYGQFTIVYPNSNTISAVSELTANMLVNIGYSTTNPLIKPKLTTKIDGLEDWDEVVEKTGSDDVKAICELNGVDYYYNGVAWAVSSGYSQSNSVAEVLANKSSLLTEGYGKNFRVGRYLHSADGSTTPKLDTDTLSVNFSGISPTIKEIFIYGNLRDIIEGLESTTIYYRWPWSVGGKVVLTDDYQEYETFPEGYFEISIKHEDGHPPAYFEFKIKTKLFRFAYPSDELLEAGDYIEIGDLNLLFTKRIVSF